MQGISEAFQHGIKQKERVINEEVVVLLFLRKELDESNDRFKDIRSSI